MINATVGQFLVNDALPEDLRDYNRVLDGPAIKSLLQNVARNHPEKYRDISYRLNQVGLRSAQDQGGMSFGARHLLRSKVANETRERIQTKLQQILANDSLSDKDRADQIVKAVGSESMPQIKAVLDEAIKNKNPLGMQVMSGTRGKAMNLASLIASDMLYSDHHDEVIPIPVLRSYSEGLSPEEYWAGTYGARRGIMSTKFATQEAGFLSKQLNQAGHRLVVMGEEPDETPDAPLRGMIADTDDSDNEGSLLAADTGPYKKNTPLTPKILNHLKRLGKNRILVRSPIIGGSPEGGVYARDVGVRENGALPGRGEQVGLQAAQALSEPISQGQLSAKHSGGVAGQEKAVGGFQYINQLIQTPKKMQGGAAHSTLDGRVQRIEPAPAGGHNVIINGQKHYVGDGFELKVKQGDDVEAGDMISDGIPNPSIITQYKGVGEGRRYFVNEFRKAMANSGMRGHRRNIELLARGLINHVKLTEETDDHVPDDVIPYSTLEHTYKPRAGHEVLTPKKAVGQYLERPVLHYTIGTKIRPSMLKDFDEFGVTNVVAHKNPPPFEPHMVRGMYQLQHDPDWLTQMYGSGLKSSLLESAARGATSEARGTSFVSSLATGTDFGEVPDRAVIQPHKPYPTPSVPLPKIEEPAAPKLAFFGGKFSPMTKKAVQATPPAPKAPSPTTLPATTSSTPKVQPTSAQEVFSSNIMPPEQTSVTTGITNASIKPSAPALNQPTNNQNSNTNYYNPTYKDQMFDFQKNIDLIQNGGRGPSRNLATSRHGLNDFYGNTRYVSQLTQPQNNAATNFSSNQSNATAITPGITQESMPPSIQTNEPGVTENNSGNINSPAISANEMVRPLAAYGVASQFVKKPPSTPSNSGWLNKLLKNPIGNMNRFAKTNAISDTINELVAKKEPGDYLEDFDAYQNRANNLAQGVYDTFGGLSQMSVDGLGRAAAGFGQAAEETGMIGLGIATGPINALSSVVSGNLFSSPAGTPEGDFERRAAKAKNQEIDPSLPNLVTAPSAWDYFKYYGLGIPGPPLKNPLDPRGTYQYTMPWLLGGETQPDPIQFQTPENQEIIKAQRRFTMLGPQGKRALIKDSIKQQGENAYAHFGKLLPEQQEEVKNTLREVLPELYGAEEATRMLKELGIDATNQPAAAPRPAPSAPPEPLPQNWQERSRRIGGARNY